MGACDYGCGPKQSAKRARFVRFSNLVKSNVARSFTSEVIEVPVNAPKFTVSNPLILSYSSGDNTGFGTKLIYECSLIIRALTLAVCGSIVVYSAIVFSTCDLIVR